MMPTPPTMVKLIMVKQHLFRPIPIHKNDGPSISGGPPHCIANHDDPITQSGSISVIHTHKYLHLDTGGFTE